MHQSFHWHGRKDGVRSWSTESECGVGLKTMLLDSVFRSKIVRKLRKLLDYY